MSGTNGSGGSAMDGLVTLALVGTARHNSAADTATNTPIDDLTAPLPTEEPERALLLRAGAFAIYRQAGKTSRETIELPTPAAPETRPPCSPGAATLIGRMLRESNVLLPEALERLNRAGQRLPFDLLPDAFNGRNEEHRKLLAPVLGERGRWLSHFVDSWDWVDATLIELAGKLPPDADDIWQEGKLEQRLALLRQARQFAPERARAWVEAVWKQEKADTREKLIECYEINLSLADEPFLEAALDDRGKDVRAIAIRLLTRLPGSAFATRAIERADAMLDHRDSKLIATPPKEALTAWARDGLTVNADKERHKSKGARALLLTEALAQVNPVHWQERFGLTPDELIDALGEKNEWMQEIRDGWTQAALSYKATGWMLPLWRWRHAVEAEAKRYYHSDPYTGQLLYHTAENERRSFAFDMLARYPIKASSSQQAQQWEEAIRAMPQPWDEEFSRAYLDGLRTFASSLTPGMYQSKTKVVAPWVETLTVAQTALAISSIAEATQSFEFAHLEEGKFDWRVNYAHTQLKDFTNTMRLRQQLYDELP